MAGYDVYVGSAAPVYCPTINDVKVVVQDAVGKSSHGAGASDDLRAAASMTDTTSTVSFGPFSDGTSITIRPV